MNNSYLAFPKPLLWRLMLGVVSVCVLLVLLYQFAYLLLQLDTSLFWAAVSRPQNWLLLLAVVVLMPINWLLESLKWQKLLGHFLPWSFGQCWRAVLAGVALGAATPNRVGEVGGRLLLARRSERVAVLTAALLGGGVQWQALLMLGLPALYWVSGGLSQGEVWWWLLLLLGLISAWWWQHRRYCAAVMLRQLPRRWRPVPLLLLQQLKQFPQWRWWLATAFALLRIGVYAAQLYLLLGVFGLHLPLGWGLASIVAAYLLQAGLPLPPGLNLLARAEVGILLWGNSPAVAAAALAAFSTAFLINVLLPSLPAYWLIVKKLNHEIY